MEDQKYQCVINAGCTNQETFDFINDLPLWWTVDFEGSTQNVGDTFTVHFGDIFKTFEVKELVAGKKIIWQVIDCYMPWLENKHEWTGTSIIWDISTENNSTKVTMTHLGLVPEVECYKDCEKGWNYYLNESLAKLLNGEPAKPEPVMVKTM